MAEITLLVKSSSKPEPYTINIINDSNGLSFHCDCPAGRFNTLCKHVLSLAAENESILYNSEQKEKFNKVVEWLQKSDYSILAKEYEEAEVKFKAAQKTLKRIKKKIATIIRK